MATPKPSSRPDGQEKIRKLDPERNRLTLRDHAVRAITLPDTEGKTRFGTNGRENIDDTSDENLSGGAAFRREVLTVLGRLRTEFTAEELNLLLILKISYDEMVQGLKDKKIPLDGIYTWEQIQAKLTPDHLARALLMQKQGLEPRIVITPPQTRQQLVTAIDAHKVEGQKFDTYQYELNNDDLFNGGQVEKDLTWEVEIMECVENVPDDSEIRGTNEERAPAWVEKHTKDNFDTVNRARPYLAAVIQALSAGRRLDSNTFTVLNAKTRKKGALLGGGAWGRVQLYLNLAAPAGSGILLRARASVRVDMV